MIPAEIKRLRQLPDDDPELFVIACAVHRRQLRGPLGEDESVQNHETAEALIKFRRFVKSDSVPDALKHAVADHPSVLPSTVQGMAENPHNNTRVQKLASHIERRRANLRDDTTSDS